MTESKPAGLFVRLAQDAPIPLDAEFACGSGEVLALVGPSGSGKSTILRCIAGLNTPPHGLVTSNGDIWLDSAQGLSRSPQSRAVGIVFQHYALFPHMSALDNVATALGDLANGEAAKRARELLDLVHLNGLEERYPGQLSGGQQQRVALARALAREPAALLLDEPFSSVDQVTKEKLHRELAHLRQRLKTPVILVTHDLNEAVALADRLCILHRGRTLQTGTPTEVMARPDNPLIARLVGLRNIFEGRVVAATPTKGKIEWAGRTLEVENTGAFKEGDKVSWVIPPSGIILHRDERPSRGDNENPVHGVISETLDLGASLSMVVDIDAAEDKPFSFSVSAHVAERNGLAAGKPISVSFVAGAIHLMEREQIRR
jgi:molybdate transport system ATP-binding protein